MSKSEDAGKYQVNNDGTQQSQVIGDHATVHIHFHGNQNKAPSSTKSRKFHLLFALVSVLTIVLVPGIGSYLFKPMPSPKLILNNPLDSQNDSNGWSTPISPEGGCQFVKGAYQASEVHLDGYYYCINGYFNALSDMKYRVDMQILHGDCGGLLFRLDDMHQNFYAFEVCEDGSYKVFIYTNGTGKCLISKQSQAIHTGSQHNQLLIQAKGRNFDFFVNNNLIDTIEDATYTRGYIGVIASHHSHSQVVVAFRDAKVWSL